MRLDGHTWRQLKADDPLTVELGLLCRDEIALIEQRTALVCQLRAALHEYYPVALQAFDDWTLRSTWAFIEAFPTPAGLTKAGKRKWEKFLHTHKLYNTATYAKRLKLFAKHPDHDMFGSLPGAGEKLAPRLLAGLGDNRDRFDSPEGLQCYAGTAPVSYQSGQMKRVRFRRACEAGLRHTVHLWANLSRAKCPWAEAYYQKKRKDGQSHACVLRCLGQRWLKILWKMWQERERYDPEFHQRNQLKHGSWVIGLMSAQNAQSTAAGTGTVSARNGL